MTAVTVETVKGPVDLDALGPTLMHEHVFVMQPEPLTAYVNMFGSGYWDEEERVADAIAKLTRLREGGITTIVEPTAFGLGRHGFRGANHVHGARLSEWSVR